MTDLKVEETVGGFKYMKVSRLDCIKWGGLGFCDLCNSVFDFGYLLPITSGCYCKKCFDKYLSGDRVIDEHDKVVQDDIADGFFKYHIDKIKEVDKEHPDLRLCPKCDGLYTGYPAISRRDNKTEICSACGFAEALEDAYNNMGEEE